jgi:hypothetical protein
VTFDDSEFVFWLSSHNFSGAAKAAKTHGLSADDVSGCTPDDLIQLLGITRTEAHDVVVRFSQMRLLLLLLSLDCLQSNAMRKDSFDALCDTHNPPIRSCAMSQALIDRAVCAPFDSGFTPREVCLWLKNKG